jgi:hypothetical protein
MEFHEPTEKEVLEFEQGIDDFVAQAHLPGEDFGYCAYQALTLIEDRPRCKLMWPDQVFTGQPDDPALVMLSGLLGRNVFALRHLLERLWRKKRPQGRSLSRMKVDGDAYVKMGKAIDLFNDYHYVSHALKGYRTHHWNCRMDSRRRFLEFVPKPRHDGYDALTFCLAGPETNESTPLQHWITWARFPQTRPDVISAIVSSARVIQHDRIVYTFEPEIAEALHLSLPFIDMGVPENWNFPWGVLPNVRCLVGALHLRCIYHLCAIHFTAEQHNVEGGGVDDLCLITSRGTPLFPRP